MGVTYETGDVVVVSMGGFGDRDRVVRVDGREDDIKNGRPGFYGVVVEGREMGLSVWGYDDQIAAVRPQ